VCFFQKPESASGHNPRAERFDKTSGMNRQDTALNCSSYRKGEAASRQRGLRGNSKKLFCCHSTTKIKASMNHLKPSVDASICLARHRGTAGYLVLQNCLAYVFHVYVEILQVLKQNEIVSLNLKPVQYYLKAHSQSRFKQTLIQAVGESGLITHLIKKNYRAATDRDVSFFILFI